MTTLLQKSQLKQRNILGKIKVEGEVDEEQKIIVGYETVTLKWKGFESQMAMWAKVYERI